MQYQIIELNQSEQLCLVCPYIYSGSQVCRECTNAVIRFRDELFTQHICGFLEEGV